MNPDCPSNPLLQQKAQKVFTYTQEEITLVEQQNYKSVILILTIISIIVSLLRLMEACKKKGLNDVARMHNPGLIEKGILKFYIHSELKKKEGALRYSKQIYIAMIRVGAEVTSQELETLYQEASTF